MRRSCAILLLVALAACATTGVSGEGDRNLPTVGVGPFRKLAADEVREIAPFVYDDRLALYREPAVVADGAATLLYVVAKRDGRDVIVRTRAEDGRAFYGSTSDFGKTAPVVLTADQAWEGTSVSGPFVLRTAAGFVLYYAAAGGIGSARSSDGLTFQKDPGPLLARDPGSAWESTEVRAPSAYVLAGGRVRLLYSAGTSIGEAESTDGGAHFARLSSAPILGPAPDAAPGSLLPHEKPPFDTARVADPCASLETTPVGRPHLRVLYTGYDGAGVSAIGYAGRFGDQGPLERQPSPIYSVDAKEAAPALLQTGDTSYLYVQQDRRVDDKLSYTAIAAAYAPGTAHLPTPAEFPSSP